MTPLSLVAFLFWLLLISAAVTVALDRPLRQMLRSSWKPLGMVLLATVLWRTPWDGVFFHGLEYEDSYVYTVAGRQLAEHVHPPSNDLEPTFSFSVCAMGSISDCKVWEPFPEHLVGYPYVIGLASSLFGYTPAVGSLVNLLASLISAAIVFIFALTIAKDSLIALLSGILFAVLPVFAVYGLETSAEPFSCCCLLTALWFFIRLWDMGTTSALVLAVRWLAYTCALLFAQTVKREDAILALVLPVSLLFLLPEMSRRFPGRLRLRSGLMVTSSIFAIMLSIKMNLLATSKEEQELLSRFPLTGARVVGFVASFMTSFTELRWYEGTFLIVIAGICFGVRKRNFTVIPAFLLGTFIIIYACHIRGYYEMESGRVSPESSLRFSMNLMGLWAILGGLGLGELIRWLQSMETFRSRQTMLRYLLSSAAGMFVLVSFLMTLHLKSYAVEDEANSRVTPAVVAVETASLIGLAHSSILTMEPLVVQMYAGNEPQIVDLESLDTPTLDVLLRSNSKLLLLKQDDRFMVTDVERYGAPLRRILALPSKRLNAGERFSVSLIEPDDAH